MIRNEDIDDGPFWSKPHKVCCCAQTIACNLLFHPCRRAVSGNKNRYEIGGYDLDLVYMTPRIIIHGFPSAGLEHIYRNPRYEIRRLLETKHQGKYKLFNFCCEAGRGYDGAIFDNRVERYPFKDHNTPPLETMVEFANSAKLWLDADPENVVSMHCKAGKGRAGLMCCITMLRHGVVNTAQEAFEKYDAERVKNKKGLTVTSQRKFVIFYETLWRKYWNVQGNLENVPGEPVEGPRKYVIPPQPVMRITKIEIVNLDGKKWSGLRIKSFKGTNFAPELLYDSGKNNTSKTLFVVDYLVQGNFKIGAFKPGTPIIGKATKLFDFWHNTLFIAQNKAYVDFGLDQLDIKSRTLKKLDKDLKLRLYFSQVRPSDLATASDVNVEV